MDRKELKTELTRGSKWLRLLWMLLFIVIFQIVELILLLAAAVQFLLTLFTGRSNEQVRTFGNNLALYVQQIIAYLTYASEERPFPFTDWPQESSHEAEH